TVLRKYAKLQKEMATQLAHSEYYKTVLREYAKLQDKKRVEGKSENKDISIAIKIAAPNPEQAVVWGDYHLALALQRGLRKAGFSARVDTVSEWYDDTRQDDVVLVFRGLRRYETKPNQLNIMWNISHPDKVTLQEYESYDLVLVASDKYAEVLQRKCLVPVRVMHQFSDPQIFSPKFVDSNQTDLLFVGNSRGQYRDAVKACVEQNLKVDVYGRKWEAFVSDEYIKGEYISQGDLGGYYHSARIVLNDHWDSMREFGFVSNRVYDVGASGGFLLTDNCAGIREMFGDALAVFDDGKDLKRQVEYFLDHPEERLQKAKKLREIVLNAHTLTNRVEQLAKLINDLLTRGKTAQTATMPETNGPKVSIIMACHNAAAFLPETMDTILAQTLKEWELLVTDDGSTDTTRQILETYAAKDQRIRLWFFDDKKGPYVRRNFAIEQARSPFICIQDADDLMAANKLEILYEEINRDERLGIVGSFYRRFLETFRGADFGDRMEKRITHEELMAAFGNCWHLCWHGSAIIGMDRQSFADPFLRRLGFTMNNRMVRILSGCPKPDCTGF
ncbi:MAG: glycosyltransferase, partial [Planctomycetota bacterium]